MKEIIAENRSRVKAIIRKLTGSYNEDIEQEVYIKTWRNLKNYKEEGKFTQWISALTANVCRDYFKSRQYKIGASQLSDDDVLETYSDSQSQEEALDAKQRQRVILRAVDALPRKLRQVIILYEFEEMSYEQIAKKTGLPVGTIKSRLFNARKILAEKLKNLKGE